MRIQFGVAEPNFNAVGDAIFMRFVLYARERESPANASRAFSIAFTFLASVGLGNHLHI